MERCKFLLSILLGMYCSFALIAANAGGVPVHSPVGYWKTIDDVTGKAKSIVHIWKTEEDILMGKIVKVFAKDNNSRNHLCTKCKGEKRDQPVVGMVVVSGLKSKEKQWVNGEILDPENGKTYNCVMRTLENGKRLHVRGYVGLPLLGRSQTWERVDLMSG